MNIISVEVGDLGKGYVMATIDLELMWGFNKALVERPWIRRSPSFRRYVRNMGKARYVVRSLLETTEELDFPLTWAIVGHLVLDRCKRSCGRAHPDMPRPRVASRLDWYAFDPCSDLARAPLWYGRDIVEAVLDSPVEHEIACHSFSHVDFSMCDRLVAEAEIRACRSLLKEHLGIRPVSFVFPFDRVGHLDLLARYGFKAFRAPRKSSLWPLNDPERLKGFVMSRLEEPLTSRLRLPPPIGFPKKIGALVEIPNTGLLYKPVEESLIILLSRLSKALLLVCRKGLLLHVYTHLHNLAQGHAYLWAFKKFLELVKEFEEQGLLCVLVMRDAVKLLNRRSSENLLVRD